MSTAPHDHLDDDVAHAIAALTTAARRTYTTPAGEERYDFGGVVTRVLAAVVANAGGVEQLLAGQPGLVGSRRRAPAADLDAR